MDIYENVSLVQRKRRREQVKREIEPTAADKATKYGEDSRLYRYSEQTYKYSVKLLTHSKSLAKPFYTGSARL